MFSAVGHSTNLDTPKAVEEILAQCRRTLQGRTPGLGVFFTSRMRMDFQSVLERIKQEWPDTQLVGCTTDGEISNVFPCVEGSLSLLLIHSDSVHFATGLGENLSGNPERAIGRAYSMALESLAAPAKLGIILQDGLTTLGIPLDKLLRQSLGQDLPVFGGSAGDNLKLRKTFLFHNDRVVTDALVLVLVSGAVLSSLGLRSGYQPIGRTFAVNRYKDNVVWEIDSLPAAEFLKKYLGTNTEEYAQFPLAVLAGEDEFVLRDPYFVNHADGSVTFFGTFPDAPRVRLTEFSREDLLKASARASAEALESYPGPSPDLALIFPCTSRRHILGTRAAEEHNVLLKHAKGNPAMCLFGMYAYGEINTLKRFEAPMFHNDTYNVLLVGEEP